MRLHDDARKCVVLLGHADAGDAEDTFDAYATGFLVRERESRALYVVTAAHCVRDAGLDDPFYLRVNTADKSVLVHIEDPAWVVHDDPAVDVAAIEVPIPPEADIVPLSMNNKMFLTSERLSVGDFGPGDQTYTVGLFSHLSGRSKNVPLVHVGHIASFPEADEKIEIPDWRAGRKKQSLWLDAYIVQCDVMPGASGSPVFVRKPITAADGLHSHADDGAVVNANRKPPLGYGAVFLLGLWKGAWELDKKRLVRGTTIRDPSGFGVVIPSYKILEVLNMPKLEMARIEAKKKINKTKSAAFVDDSLAPKVVQKRFDGALQKMLTTPPVKRGVKKA